MKTLTLALVAAALVSAPAFAQSPVPATAPAAANVPVPTLAPPNSTELSKPWTIGQKIPAAFTVTSKYAVNDESEFGLPKANNGSRWMVVGDNAYLVRSTNDIIIKIVGVTPKG